MGIAADRDSNIPVGLIAGIGQMPVIGAPIERAPTPAVGDLMKAFRDGFITVADIKKRQADMPVEASNRALQLQANDFKSKQITQLGPAELALQAHRFALDEKKIEALEKDLNANEDTRPAREAYTLTKAQHDAELVSPDPKVRRDAVNRQHFYDLEKAYSSATGEPVPESFEVEESARVDDFSTWLQKTLPDKVNALEADFAAAYPQALPEDVLKFREDAKTETLKNAGADYNEYKTNRGKQKDVVQQGTPEYYKELQRRLTEGVGKQLTRQAEFKTFEVSEKARAEAAAKAEFPDNKEVNTHERENRSAYAANPAVKAIREVASAFSKIESAVTGTSDPFKDMSAIFGFMKTLDPGSTVREGEYATAQNARGWPETIKSLYNKAVEGIKLTPDQRTQIFGVAKEAVKGQIAGAAPVIEQYLGVEARVGAPTGSIVPNQDRAAYQKFFGAGGQPSTAAPDLDAMVGKTFRDKTTGKVGVVIKNADGTYSLQ